MIKVIVNGAGGSMGRLISKYLYPQNDMDLVDVVDPKGGTLLLKTIKASVKDAVENNCCDLIVDFTQPNAVNANAELYCKYNIPFVMGTTGGDREKLAQVVKDSNVSAVIAPNMAKQVVAFQSMMEYAAETFPNAFEGFSLEIVESHQESKKDTSGTAKAMVGYFNKLSIPFDPGQIEMIRDPEAQRAMGIPEEDLGGHGWHTYDLVSADETVNLKFTHNINGRVPYVLGTLDAIRFLYKKIQEGSKGEVFSMIDVLKGI
ncbi:MAG: dihydrodipicolinate reductase C-terminal domain-containing protein [bacterium]|nr:dihydrodipicolinate reductase C-terminal domain-containing protein [bacterium]